MLTWNSTRVLHARAGARVRHTVRACSQSQQQKPSNFAIPPLARALRYSECRRQITKEAHAMIWFLERESDLLICEIRRSTAGESYEFEMAPSAGPPQTRSYTSASEMIDQYL